MIPRILVPKNARPVVSPADAPPRRLSSDLDARTLVPSDLPQFELDPHSSIPSYFKLEVLGDAVVVPRDMPNTPLDAISKTPNYVPLTILDSRVAVPKDAHAAKLEPKQIVAIQDLPDVLDPDVLTTGEVNLMTKPAEDRTEAWNAVARVRFDRVSLCGDSADPARAENFSVSPAHGCGNRRGTSPISTFLRISIESPKDAVGPAAQEPGGEGRSAPAAPTGAPARSCSPPPATA